ncbi:MAG: FMN-binding negative transcriptional regulator [Burkholderiales bacterium]
MYIPSHFAENDPTALREVVREHPLGALVVAGDDGLDSVHAPFLFDSEPAPLGTLRCHVARANPIAKAIGDGRDVLVLFRGPSAYVTPSWYATKQATGKVVPTYNYVAVQAKGRARTVADATWLHAFVTRLTENFEQRRAMPWHVTDAPADYVQGMLQAIVGIEVQVASLVGTFKMSQNRNAADRAGVHDGLVERAQDTDLAVASLVRSRGTGAG